MESQSCFEYNQGLTETPVVKPTAARGFSPDFGSPVGWSFQVRVLFGHPKQTENPSEKVWGLSPLDFATLEPFLAVRRFVARWDLDLATGAYLESLKVPALVETQFQKCMACSKGTGNPSELALGCAVTKSMRILTCSHECSRSSTLVERRTRKLWGMTFGSTGCPRELRLTVPAGRKCLGPAQGLVFVIDGPRVSCFSFVSALLAASWSRELLQLLLSCKFSDAGVRVSELGFVAGCLVRNV